MYPYMTGLLVVPSERRLVVKSVLRGSPAFDAGIAPGDVVFARQGDNNTNIEGGDSRAILHLASLQLLLSGVDEAMEALDDEQQRGAKSLKYHVQLSSPKGSARFDGEAEYLAFRLLALVDTIDKERAERIKSKFQSLQMAPNPDLNTPLQVTGAVSVSPTPQTATGA